MKITDTSIYTHLKLLGVLYYSCKNGAPNKHTNVFHIRNICMCKSYVYAINICKSIFISMDKRRRPLEIPNLHWIPFALKCSLAVCVDLYMQDN